MTCKEYHRDTDSEWLANRISEYHYLLLDTLNQACNIRRDHAAGNVASASHEIHTWPSFGCRIQLPRHFARRMKTTLKQLANPKKNLPTPCFKPTPHLFFRRAALEALDPERNGSLGIVWEFAKYPQCRQKSSHGKKYIYILSYYIMSYSIKNGGGVGGRLYGDEPSAHRLLNWATRMRKSGAVAICHASIENRRL